MGTANPEGQSRPVWHKSSYSANGANCVEVAHNAPGTVMVRDSQDKNGPLLTFEAHDWQAFTSTIKAGKHPPA